MCSQSALFSRFAGIVSILLLSLAILQGCYVAPPVEESAQQSTDLHVVAASSTKRELAVEAAKRFRAAGYSAEVYRTSTQYYAVTLGHYPPAKARELKAKVIAQGLAGPDAYLTGGKGFLKKIYPETDQALYYIVAATSKTEADAKNLARQLEDLGYRSEVYLTKNKKYAVTLDRLPKKEAENLKGFAIRKGIVEDDSYLTTGSEFLTRRFPEGASGTSKKTIRPTAKELFIVVLTTADEGIAVQQADKYHRMGYKAEVYLTMNEKYVVTIGLLPREQARALKEKVVLNRTAPSDAYLSTGENFMERIYTTVKWERSDP